MATAIRAIVDSARVFFSKPTTPVRGSFLLRLTALPGGALPGVAPRAIPICRLAARADPREFIRIAGDPLMAASFATATLGFDLVDGHMVTP